MWWILGAIICVAIALLTGAFIRAGNPWGNDDDYMIGDEDTDLGDKS